MKTAVIAGATGLIGGHCLKALLADPAYERVIAVGRRLVPIEHPKLDQRLADLGRMGVDPANSLRGDDVFCCLGSTLKKAGSRSAFETIDRDYPIALGRAAKAGGAHLFSIVTAIDADPGARVFYNRVKGEAEEGLRNLGFERLHVFRPSLLLGDRAEPRPLERFSQKVLGGFAPAMRGPLKRYRPIEARRVALAMVARAAEPLPAGVRVFESDEI